jgi:putative methyltransferase (TIGR04325 family)
MNFRNIAKNILPPVISKNITGFFYGWHGNYSTWDEALGKCSGYDSDEVFNKVKTSSFKVKNGLATCERDSVCFNEMQYNFPLATALLMVAAHNNSILNVLDFGGALGSSYYQNRAFIGSLKEYSWSIVEQQQFVEIGISHFRDNNLQFYYSIEDCLKEKKIDVVLLSSVLPYLKNPYELLKNIIDKKFKYVFIDKMPLIRGNDRITIQKVNPKIYNASYPSWFFNEKKLLDFMESDYSLVYEFFNNDRANIPCEFKGYVFKMKENE